jgi:hypothetical protein
MAKQKGEHPFTGKLGATIGYKANGEHLERENGSKEGKAFRKDPRRWRTMYYAGLMAEASKAMVLIYRGLPEDQQKHGVYGKLCGKAFSLIRLGSSIEEVKRILTKQYVEDKAPLVIEQAESNQSAGNAGTVAGDPQLSTSNPVPVQQSAANPTRQNHVVAVIPRPYFCSTVSG